MQIGSDVMLLMRVSHQEKPLWSEISPTSLRMDIMWNTHKGLHAGMVRTAEWFRLIWFRSGVVSSVWTVIKHCESCQLAKSGLMTDRERWHYFAERSWQRLGLDIVGPLLETDRKASVYLCWWIIASDGRLPLILYCVAQLTARKQVVDRASQLECVN